MSSILGLCFGNHLPQLVDKVLPHAGVTILSQMAREILSQSWIGSILAPVLILYCHDSCNVANTGFQPFQCCPLIWQKNKYMPHMCSEKVHVGYSNGILTLAIGAITLLFIFRKYGTVDSTLYHQCIHSICSFSNGMVIIGFVNMVRDSETLFS